MSPSWESSCINLTLQRGQTPTESSAVWEPQTQVASWGWRRRCILKSLLTHQPRIKSDRLFDYPARAPGLFFSICSLTLRQRCLRTASGDVKPTTRNVPCRSSRLIIAELRHKLAENDESLGCKLVSVILDRTRNFSFLVFGAIVRAS